jgi:RNA polymerase sigma factor (sigma-70 family)
MDRATLKQYLPLKREQERLEKKIDRLYERLDNVPEVMGKVKGSMREHPYIETHVSVRMLEPRENDTVNRLIRINENRKQQVDALLMEIEEYIEAIPDSVTRQIFEMVFLEGKKQREVADELGLERSSISKKITGYLQLSHNSQK